MKSSHHDDQIWWLAFRVTEIDMRILTGRAGTKSRSLTINAFINGAL
jgi:hypothetical protein